MQSTLRRSTPQAAYCASRESYQAWPAALSLTPQLVGSHGQASVVSAASCAWKLELAMGRLRSTEARGMPRTMWMPNLRPWAWTQSARGSKLLDVRVACNCVAAGLWVVMNIGITADGNRCTTGTYLPKGSMA
jgi:hypothetical protein